ncbi:MAG: hypothetical protein ABSG68_08945 [Thermoguttaceae bacterium]|jgi:hypothetical protein
MDRRSPRYGSLAVVGTAAALLLSVSGCVAGLTTLAYFTRGNNVDPDFGGLKDKKVAVVCRSTADLQYNNASAVRALGQEISNYLKTNIPTAKMIDQQKVAKWVDENGSEEYRAVGKALGAEVVVGVDLEAFSIYQGQTLYQGKANARVVVYDLTKNKKGEENKEAVFEKDLPQVVYPPNISIPVQDRPEPEFRSEFVRVLAQRIARQFYAHDAQADVAQDVDAGLK